MAYRLKSNTKLRPDEILDTAADILEQHGWVTGECHNGDTGGHCAIGAVARAVYPRATSGELERLAYIGRDLFSYRAETSRTQDPAHVEAMKYLVASVRGLRSRPAERVLDEFEVSAITQYNDDVPAGRQRIAPAEVLTFYYSKRVVNKLRKAAGLYRAHNNLAA